MNGAVFNFLLTLKLWSLFTSHSRKNKYVILDSKERVPYDKLFLFCGVQFDVPVEVYSEKTPYNLVLINKSLHGKMVNYRIRSLIKNSGKFTDVSN